MNVTDTLLAVSGLLGGNSGGGGGGEAVLINKSVTANGTYNASSDSADGYKKVTVNVPNTYAASDEGKVVSNGALVSQTSQTVTENGTVDTTLVNSVTVNVAEKTTGDPNAQKFEYVQAVDGSAWHLTDFISAYLNKGEGLYWGYVDNTLNSSYAVTGFIYGNNNSGAGNTKIWGGAHRTSGWNSAVQANFSTLSTQLNIGDSITIYYISNTAF